MINKYQYIKKNITKKHTEIWKKFSFIDMLTTN